MKGTILFAGLTEAQVIEKAKAGDVFCFEALYARHKHRVFSLCLRMTGNHASSGRFHTRSIPAALSQNRVVPRGICIFHLAAPALSQRGIDALS